MKPRIKICCIGSLSEARLAVRAGASALGLVSAMPSGPGAIDEELIAAIATRVPPAIGTFLLTSRQDADAIIEQQCRCRTNTLQLVDHVPVAELVKLRTALPGISLVQVIHVTGPESVEVARDVAPYVDAILLDSGNQKLPVKELGGTGRTHDWRISREIRDALSLSLRLPVFLAGGLKPANVRYAVAAVEPFGLDICSGVRGEGKLDADKLQAFIQAALA